MVDGPNVPSVPVLTPGIQTTEFWVTAIKGVVGLLTMAGVIAPAAHDTMLATIGQIVGAAVAIESGVSYLWSRTWLKGNTAAQQTASLKS